MSHNNNDRIEQTDESGTEMKHERHDQFRCEDCGNAQRPPSHRACEECGGLIREYLPMEAPIYQVDIPGLGTIWFNADEYSGAFEYATGQRVEQAGDDHEEESRITLVDFEGVAEVPVADV